MFWSTVWRMIVVPVSFIVAALFTAFVLVTLGMERATHAIHGKNLDETDSLFAIFDLVGQSVVLASGLTLLPAIALVLIGEISRIRSVLYYMLGGGAALISVPLITRFGESGDLVLPNPVVWQVFATAGFAGGFIYWLMAGRRA